jgi:hypothetical protein
MSYTKSKAQQGKGTVLAIVAGQTSTPVGELDTLNLTGRQTGTEDVTNFDSAMKEFIASLPDPGSWDFSGNRVGSDAGQVAMETAFQASSTESFTITLPKTGAQQNSGDVFAFDGIIEKLNYSIAATKKIAVSGSIKVSGPITITPGS